MRRLFLAAALGGAGLIAGCANVPAGVTESGSPEIIINRPAKWRDSRHCQGFYPSNDAILSNKQRRSQRRQYIQRNSNKS